MSFALETSRLRLRQMVWDDLDFLATLLGDAEVMRFYPRPYTREEAAAWLQRQLDRYASDGYGLWLVVDRQTGEPRGQAGPCRRDIDGQPEIDIGWLIHRPFWRQGFATEAGVACRDYVWETLQHPRVLALIRPENVPSIGVAQKLEMISERRTLFCDREHHVFVAQQLLPTESPQ